MNKKDTIKKMIEDRLNNEPKIIKQKQNSIFQCIAFLIIGLVIGFFLFKNAVNWARPKYFSKNWTLMICETPHFSGGCAENRYILEGYKSQTDCMEKGISLRNQAGFECGYGCHLSDGGGLQVCDKVCNENGCN